MPIGGPTAQEGASAGKLQPHDDTVAFAPCPPHIVSLSRKIAGVAWQQETPGLHQNQTRLTQPAIPLSLIPLSLQEARPSSILAGWRRRSCVLPITVPVTYHRDKAREHIEHQQRDRNHEHPSTTPRKSDTEQRPTRATQHIPHHNPRSATPPTRQQQGRCPSTSTTDPTSSGLPCSHTPRILTASTLNSRA